MILNLGKIKNSLPYALAQRADVLEKTISLSFTPIIESSKNHLTKTVQENHDLIAKMRLSWLFTTVLRISNVVIKFFNSRYQTIDHLLAVNELAGGLCKKYIEILNFSSISAVTVDILKYNSRHIPEHIKLGVYGIQQFQYRLYSEELDRLRKYIDKMGKTPKTAEEQSQMFASMPKLLQEALIAKASARGISAEQIAKNLKLLTKKEPAHATSLWLELKNDYNAKMKHCESLANQLCDEITKNTPKAGSKIIDPTENRYIYSASCDELIEQLRPNRRPISVVMASVEYAGLVKEGGLAEAVEGLSKGLLEHNPKNKVSLVFPKFSILPTTILQALKDPKTYKTPEGISYKVYTYNHGGVECKFIEHDAFILPPGHQSVYGPSEELQSERFAAFSALAADYIEKQLKPDIVHIHDWHAAGIGIQLKKHAKAQQKAAAENGSKKKQQEKKPAIVFTFHNHNRMAQGRVRVEGGNVYNYAGLSSAYARWRIIEDSENLFITMLNAADVATTVSETFAEESQDMRGDTQGIAFAVRAAARAGKFFGILNGANPHAWNPKTNPVLEKWKSIESNTPLDLRYGTDDEDIVAKKKLSKEQLQEWVKKYQPHLNIDFSKPIVTFIGRLDSNQKGLDKLDEAIASTLANGGQFICMGSGDHPDAVGKEVQDPKAKEILDYLQHKYKEGVFWLRDYKEKEGPNRGKFHYQQGSEDRPGIGPLVRAASDFIFVPSSFEPCGLVQFEGWLFGSMAIGSRVGGLADSIITQEKDKKHFNGFLFSRDNYEADSCGSVIYKALKFWTELSHQDKNALIRRVMQDGKKQSWTTSPHQYSPVEKYNYVYQLGKLRAKTDGAYKAFNAEQMRKKLKVLEKQPMDGYAEVEELYMVNYTHAQSTGISTRELESLYYLIPEGARAQFPSPYGVNVDDAKYLKYGAKHTNAHTDFVVYAPKAHSVEVQLFDEHHQLTSTHKLEKEGDDWKVRLPAIAVGQRYQYKVNGHTKIDPYSRQMQLSHDGKKVPYSIVTNSNYKWSDEEWIQNRLAGYSAAHPISIYEMHPTAWKKKDGSYMNYRELAEDLVKHVKQGGFTHVEMMALMEHPHEGSWGYQPIGYFAPNSRLGSVDDLKYLINHLHKNKIGVVLDWVSAHFAPDKYALDKFDGTHLFEPNPTDLSYRLSPRNLMLGYGSRHFDYTKEQVREFLISSANFWLKEMHIDGLRVDCLRSMLSSEKPADAELFLRDFNAVVHKKNPGTFTAAEDYSGHPKLLQRLHSQGLGFDFKWNVGLKKAMGAYFALSPASRKSSYQKLKKALIESYFEPQIAYISHDELKSHGNVFNPAEFAQILKQGQGSDAVANWKSVISCLMTTKGPKLLFSGSEFASKTEWDQWIGTENSLMETHKQLTQEQKNVFALTKALNNVTSEEEAFFAPSATSEWINDPSNTLHAYRAKADNSRVAVIHNFTSQDVQSFKITLPKHSSSSSPVEIFNSDNEAFGGQNRRNLNIKILSETPEEIVYEVKVPALTTLIIKES